MLDRIIAERTSKQQVMRAVQRVARTVALPALGLMLGGLLAHAVQVARAVDGASRRLPGPNAVPVEQLLRPVTWLSSSGAMSLGLLGLTLVPGITVVWILVGHLRARRWFEALVAAAVAAILTFSIFMGHK